MPDCIEALPAEEVSEGVVASDKGSAGIFRGSRQRSVIDSYRTEASRRRGECSSCTSADEESEHSGEEDASDAPHPALHLETGPEPLLPRETLCGQEAAARSELAEEEKRKGNKLFHEQKYASAIDHYTDALELSPLEGDISIDEDAELLKASLRQQRCVLFANRAACHLCLEDYERAVADCSSAIELDGEYAKAYVRRAKAFEALEEYERGLEDVQRVFKLEANDGSAKASVHSPSTSIQGYKAWGEAYILRVGPLAEKRREEMKDEMIEKLKELGNSFLGNFGLSLDNFKAEQGPDGGYSIKFG